MDDRQTIYSYALSRSPLPFVCDIKPRSHEKEDLVVDLGGSCSGFGRNVIFLVRVQSLDCTSLRCLCSDS